MTPVVTITSAHVRNAVDEWHIECHFSDGQKYAAVTVAYEKEDLAHEIAAFLTRKNQVSEEQSIPNKVTLEEVEAAVVREDYTVLPDGRTTICTLTLYNGFTVRGESSCVAIENFNPELGNKFSKQRALDQVWFVLGVLLAEKRYQAGLVQPVVDVH